MAQRETYTHKQLEKYFDHISLSHSQRQYDVATLRDEEALDYLVVLQKHQLVAVPFENLSLHYSTHHTVSIDPQALFKKIVNDQNKRGGYCMESNTLFGTVLFSLGFSLYSVGARVNDTGSGYKGW